MTRAFKKGHVVSNILTLNWTIHFQVFYVPWSLTQTFISFPFPTICCAFFSRFKFIFSFISIISQSLFFSFLFPYTFLSPFLSLQLTLFFPSQFLFPFFLLLLPGLSLNIPFPLLSHNFLSLYIFILFSPFAFLYHPFLKSLWIVFLVSPL